MCHETIFSSYENYINSLRLIIGTSMLFLTQNKRAYLLVSMPFREQSWIGLKCLFNIYMCVHNVSIKVQNGINNTYVLLLQTRGIHHYAGETIKSLTYTASLIKAKGTATDAYSSVVTINNLCCCPTLQ